MLANVREVEPYLESVLNDVAAASPIAVEARGCGFFRSLELVERGARRPRARGHARARRDRAHRRARQPVPRHLAAADQRPLARRRARRGARGRVGRDRRVTAPFRHALDGLVPYEPGRPVEIVQRELGLAGPIVKLASNEGPWGPVPAAWRRSCNAARAGNRYPDGGCYALRTRARRAPRRSTSGRSSSATAPTACSTTSRSRCSSPGDEVAFCWPSFPVYPINAAKMGAVAVRAPLAGSQLRPRRARRGVTRAHEDRLRHEPEQPDRRHGRARGARALPRRAARARPARARRGLLRVRRRPRLPRRRERAARARGAAASSCARSRRSTGSRASASATGSARRMSPPPASRSRTRST